MRKYIFEYRVKGVFHDPWNPTHIVKASNLKEASVIAIQEIKDKESRRWGHPMEISIVDSRPWVKPPPVEPFTTIRFPKFKKDLSKLHTWEWDIRDIMSVQPMTCTYTGKKVKSNLIIKKRSKRVSKFKK